MKFLVTRKNDTYVFFKNGKPTDQVPGWVRERLIGHLARFNDEGEAFLLVESENKPDSVVVLYHSERKVGGPAVVTPFIEGLRYVPEISKEYYINNKLGEGAFGEVYLAVSHSVNDLVALKKIYSHRVDVPDLKEEFEIMKNLSAPQAIGGSGCHIGIVCYYELFFTIDQKNILHRPVFWLAMQYLSGLSLFDVFTALKGKGMKTENLAKLMKHLLIALDYIHSRGVAHLDIKTENIIMSNNEFYIIDFGFACMLPIKACYPTGTPDYMDPMLMAARKMGAASTYQGYMKADIWSLGAVFLELASGQDIDILYEKESKEELDDRVYIAIAQRASSSEGAMMTGKDIPNIPSEPLDRILREVDPKLADLIARMLIIDYKKRPSASELITRLLTGGDLIAKQLA